MKNAGKFISTVDFMANSNRFFRIIRTTGALGVENVFYSCFAGNEQRNRKIDASNSFNTCSHLAASLCFACTKLIRR